MVRHIFLFAILVFSGSAVAGVTIHFNGQLKDASDVEKVAEAACAVAKAKSWRCESVSGPKDAALDNITVQSLRELDGSADLSKANGVVIYPADMSEPLYLVFGAKNKLDNFIKTQFAGADTHIGVIEIFDAVKPFFRRLEITDEGRYWETRSRANLEEDLASVAAQIAAIKSQRPDVTGPVKRPDGRILDLVAGER
ncbi:hypothetical protein [Rhodanobacter sp. C03]|uniref:hypothetical protein n=1 Tax=Rhodanobacter sp. C03 TaxID=1945858 RepID=UPI000984EC4B|nr:hypothetical protein [Rhodanobacter sp. C03]OOG57294.1 hypothetical protein B0E48_07505 [Rhodanobacter sp. C03]